VAGDQEQVKKKKKESTEVNKKAVQGGHSFAENWDGTAVGIWHSLKVSAQR
jgi:hypothetical protein